MATTSAKGIIAAVVTVVIAFTMLPTVFTSYADAESIDATFNVDSESAFNDAATLTSINVTGDGTIKLDDTATSGTYVSEEVNRSDRVLTLHDAAVDVVEATSSSTVTFTVETSDDGFSTVDESVSETITSTGTSDVNLTDIDGEGFRVDIELSRSTDTDPNPEVDAYSVDYSYPAGDTVNQLLQLVILIFLAGLGLATWNKMK